MPKGRRNTDISGEWFEHSGLPEGLWAKNMHIRSKGKEKEAQEYEPHDAKIGIAAQKLIPVYLGTGPRKIIIQNKYICTNKFMYNTN